MKNTILLALSATALFWTSCTDAPPSGGDAARETAPATAPAAPMALQLMRSNCASCHKLVEGGGGPVIAPGMGEIRATYLQAYPERGAFVEAMVSFSQNPTKEDALMEAAVAKYGLMPKLGVSPKDLTAIAEYVFAHEVGTAAWHQGLSAAPQVEEGADALSYEERGRKFALGTKQALGSKLLASIQEYGPAGAVDFCHIQALPITDSMSTKYGARIKRVSDRPRNPANMANAAELAYIEALKAAKAQGEELPPLVTPIGGAVRAYYAIETNDMCLKCHGRKDSDIAPDTWKVIADRYPNDQATGYGTGEVRGLFVVEMEE